MNNASTEITLAEFVQKHGIKFECHQVDKRPDSLMHSSHITRHFRCRIFSKFSKGEARRNNLSHSFGLYFSQGSAHTEDPTLAEVLGVLASDASGYENAVSATSSYQNRGGTSGSTFVNWAEEYGYPIDSRKAEKIFRTVKRQANQLKRVLGDEAYHDLLFNTERL